MYRQIIGNIQSIINDTVTERMPIKFELISAYGQGQAIAPEQTKIIYTDTTGQFTVSLWTQTPDSPEYRCVLPSGKSFNFIFTPGTGVVDFGELLNSLQN